MVESTEAGSTANEDVPAAEAIGISKQFGSTVALREVSVSLRSGRCLGLVGRNGAGKSTLVSIMSGIYGADRGEVRFDGGPAPALGDIDAWRQKISTVFQHSMVVPKLTVAENVFLNAQPVTVRLSSTGRRCELGAKQVFAEWGFENVDANALCSTLTVEQRQLVEIARALAAGRRCLLLDEPTSALERAEIQRLFERVRSMVANGVAVLYISHHLEEVFEVCDDVAVLRDGELVMSRPMAGLSKDALVAAMVGPDAATIASLEHPGAKDNGQRADHGKPCLVVEHLKAHSPRGAVRDVSFEVHHGERVALLGSLGAGVATAARAVAGSESWDSGSIEVDGTPLVPMRRDKALKTGVGYVPEDRRAEGFVRLLGVGENLTMTIVDRLANRIGAIMPSRRDCCRPPPGQTALDRFGRYVAAVRGALRRQPAKGDSGTRVGQQAKARGGNDPDERRRCCLEGRVAPGAFVFGHRRWRGRLGRHR